MTSRPGSSSISRYTCGRVRNFHFLFEIEMTVKDILEKKHQCPCFGKEILYHCNAMLIYVEKHGVMVHSHWAQPGLKQEQEPGPEQCGTIGISPCPGSGVMWKLPHSFMQPFCSGPCPSLSSSQCECTIKPETRSIGEQSFQISWTSVNIPYSFHFYWEHSLY